MIGYDFTFLFYHVFDSAKFGLTIELEFAGYYLSLGRGGKKRIVSILNILLSVMAVI